MTSRTCTIYQTCGGCQLLHLDYAKQCIMKEKTCQDLIHAYHLPIKVAPLTPSPQPFHYRNKIIVAFKRGHRGIEAGLYQEQSHQIIPYTSCLLHEPRCDALIQHLKSLIERYHLSLYDERRRTGFLRHVLIRYGVHSKQILLTLVCQESRFNGSKNFCQEMIRAFPEVRSIVLNVNRRQTSIVLGQEEKILYGSGFIFDTLCDFKFKISPSSFYQINHDQCEQLYQKVFELMKFTGQETLIDAYCGIGTIGLCASPHVKKVIGIELNPQAIIDARENAKLNQRKNITFVHGDATEYMQMLTKQHISIDALIMDPPRSGTTKALIHAIEQLQPKKIAYVSCNLETLMRDLTWFWQIGYHTSQLYPFDMFPHTSHVESVCLLSKMNK